MLLSRGSNSFTKTTTLDNVWVSRCWLEGSFAQHQNQPWSAWDPAQKQVSYKNTELAHHYVYIPWVKKTCSSILRQVLTDFQFFFTGGFCNKYATRFSLKFPPHLKHVTTLPCKTSAADAFDFQQVTSCSLACPSSGKPTWYSSILGLRLVAYTFNKRTGIAA